MKIVDTKKEPKRVKFSEISKMGGNVFYWEDRENVFMTIFDCHIGGHNLSKYCNAICLANGDLVWFDCDDLVCPIEAEIVLK